MNIQTQAAKLVNKITVIIALIGFAIDLRLLESSLVSPSQNDIGSAQNNHRNIQSTEIK